MKIRILAVILLLTSFAAPDARAEEATHPLVWALALNPKDFAGLTDKELALAADSLWNWSYLGPKAPVAGTPEELKAATKKSHALAILLLQRTPKDPVAYSRVAMIDYAMGEQMPRGAPKAAKLVLYDEMIDLATKCVAFAPKDAECWHWLATGTGRRGTTKGVINSLMSIEDVEKAWLKAIQLQPTTALPNGDRTVTNARYGLSVFYRLVPDSWLVKMIAGTRGDKKKSIDYIRAAAKTQPNRIELQKELGAALLCYGESQDDAASLAEGKQVLKAVVEGRVDKDDIRGTDPVDKRHSQELMDKPEIACGYSRDGIQDLDESKIKK